MTKWPTEDDPGIADVHPTSYGTFGIYWSNFEAMERRGGYSGPYSTREEAAQGAQDWADHFDTFVTVNQHEEPHESQRV